MLALGSRSSLPLNASHRGAVVGGGIPSSSAQRIPKVSWWPLAIHCVVCEHLARSNRAFLVFQDANMS